MYEHKATHASMRGRSEKYEIGHHAGAPPIRRSSSSSSSAPSPGGGAFTDGANEYTNGDEGAGAAQVSCAGAGAAHDADGAGRNADDEVLRGRPTGRVETLDQSWLFAQQSQIARRKVRSVVFSSVQRGQFQTTRLDVPIAGAAAYDLAAYAWGGVPARCGGVPLEDHEGACCCSAG